MEAYNTRFTPAALAPQQFDDAYWFLFRDDRLLVEIGDGRASVPRIVDPATLGVSVLRQQFLGYLDQVACFSAEIAPDTAMPADMQFHGLRRLFPLFDEAMFWVAARAVQIINWDRTHVYCGRCGAKTESRPTEHVKVCPDCGHTNYPRLAPAIIVAVERDDKLLLAHNVRHPAGFVTVLAGFTEAGESLEQTVRREVMEEVGIEVDDIRYFGSQPWPFPHSLMIAFTAKSESGEFVYHDAEISEAGWYSAENIPDAIPPNISIARQLIDDFKSRHTA